MFSRSRFFTKLGRSYFDQSSQMDVQVTALPNSLMVKLAAEIGVGTSGMRMFSASAPSSVSSGPVIVKRLTVSPRFLPEPSTGSTQRMTSAFSKLASYSWFERKLLRYGPVGVSDVHACMPCPFRLSDYAEPPMRACCRLRMIVPMGPKPPPGLSSSCSAAGGGAERT